jgi:hypothetical protein
VDSLTTLAGADRVTGWVTYQCGDGDTGRLETDCLDFSLDIFSGQVAYLIIEFGRAQRFDCCLSFELQRFEQHSAFIRLETKFLD